MLTHGLSHGLTHGLTHLGFQALTFLLGAHPLITRATSSPVASSTRGGRSSAKRSICSTTCAAANEWQALSPPVQHPVTARFGTLKLVSHIPARSQPQFDSVTYSNERRRL